MVRGEKLNTAETRKKPSSRKSMPRLLNLDENEVLGLWKTNMGKVMKKSSSVQTRLGVNPRGLQKEREDKTWRFWPRDLTEIYFSGPQLTSLFSGNCTV